MTDTVETDPIHHTQKMQVRIQEIIDHLRADIEKVSEPQLRVMFETAADVLTGLKKKFGDYKQEREKGWHGARD